MGKIYDHYQDHLEWELIDADQEITHLSFENGIYCLNSKCIIKFSRDNQYDLVSTISGIAVNAEELEPNFEKIKGTFVSGDTITGFSKDGLFKYRLYGVLIGKSTSSRISIDDPSVKFTADLIVSRIEKSFTEAEEAPVIVQEWYLCGPTEINFPRSTSRSVEKSYKRLRDGTDDENEARLIMSSDGGCDHLLVKFSNTSFIISKAPKEYGPNWSFNLSIEYRQSFGRIPSVEEREAISEFAGFIFGNQLLKIGQTSYDESLSLSVQEYQHPWSDNVVSRCQTKGITPVDIGNYESWGIAEILFNDLLPHYVEQRQPLRLKDALWKYWIARYSSLGANLPILSSAVETLADQILKNHPEIKHYYIEYNDFSALIKEELTSIEKKLNSSTNKDRIINKLKGSAQRGSNEKLEMMFEVIKLPIKEIERKAIKARNKMAHSSLGEINDEEIIETMRMTRAYETLFHRILLKILDYKGRYIDYYSTGHPTRNIDEPIPA